MNKKSAIFIAAAFLIIALAFCFAMIAKNENDKTADAEEAFLPEKKTEVCLYTVKADGEKIGVYESENDRLYMSVDTYLFTLPAKDRALIENGFEIEKNEIIHVVEDYTG